MRKRGGERGRVTAVGCKRRKFAGLMLCGVVLLTGIRAVGGDAEAVNAQTVWARNPYRVALQAGVRVQQGEALELVYVGPWLLSELTWDIKDLVYVGGGLSVQAGSRLQLQAQYWHAVTEGNGQMTDYDYLLPGIWTDFSDGPVDINSAYMLDVRADWMMFQWASLGAHLLGGYQRLFWDWSQYGGDFIYSVEGFRDFRGSFPDAQNGINYEQTFDIPYIGLGASFGWKQLQGDLRLLYSPFVRARGWDEHVLRELYFEDTFRNITYLALESSLSYVMGRHAFLSAALDWHRIPEASGNMTIIDQTDGSREYLANSAGIANRGVSMRIAVGLQW